MGQPYTATMIFESIQRHEFDALKREVEELKKALAAAQAEKVAFLKKIAEFVGVDLNDVLTP